MNLAEIYGVKIKTDKVRTMWANWDAMAQIEKELNISLFDLRNLMTLPMTDLRTVAFILLKHEDRSLTKQKVGKMFSVAELPKLAQTIAQAVGKASTIGDDDEETPLVQQPALSLVAT